MSADILSQLGLMGLTSGFAIGWKACSLLEGRAALRGGWLTTLVTVVWLASGWTWLGLRMSASPVPSVLPLMWGLLVAGIPISRDWKGYWEHIREHIR